MTFKSIILWFLLVYVAHPYRKSYWKTLIYELLITTEALTKHITIIQMINMINTDSYSKLLSSNKSQLPQRNCTYDSTH